MDVIEAITSKLPGIQEPKAYLSFKQRLKWTGLILLLFLFLGQVTVYGVSVATKERFQFLEIILGSSFGTLMTLGIGPIVTASIILQLLVGSKIIPWDLKTEEGKKKFQGVQKLLVIFFCLFEAYTFVAFGAIQPINNEPGLMIAVVLQIAFGGFLVLLMDEVVSKWGIGSGVSLFIAAGVGKSIFIRALNPLPAPGGTDPSGLIPLFVILLGKGDIYQAVLQLLPIFATIIVFLIVVYAQAIKVEIPLAFGSIRGFSRRWPLQLLYTNTIPIILVGALLANVQLVGSMMAKTTTEEGLRCGFLGCFDESNIAVSGISAFLRSPTSLQIQVFFLVFMLFIFIGGFLSFYKKFKEPAKVVALFGIAGFVLAAITANATVGLPVFDESLRAMTYLVLMVIGATIFSIFWVSTSGMDANTVAGQIEGMGMQIPGFRRDPRIVQQVLDRYIPTLAIISGLFIGILASFADFTSALGTGTGILLTVMIIYGLYEQIAMRYTEDMHPSLKKFFK